MSATTATALSITDRRTGRTYEVPIEELAERSSFLEVAYLLLRGELPEKDERAHWVDLVTHHTFVHENIKKFIDGFHHDAHPMGFPVEMFPVLFAIGRMPGWLAQWEEGISDSEQRISRPRQLCVGSPERHLDGPSLRADLSVR